MSSRAPSPAGLIVRTERRRAVVQRPTPSGRYNSVTSPTGRARDPDRRPATSSDKPVGTGAEPALTLGAPERWVLAQVRRRGVTGFVVQMTLVAVVASVVVVASLMTLLYGADDEYMGTALVMAAFVPAIVAPPVLVFTVRLADRLDIASELLWRSAHTDPLTEVPNRRAYFEALERAGASCDQALDVAILDIDGFKSINDQHGHVAGDRALRHVARWLQDLVGPQGIVARVGGDEFAVLAPVDADRPRPARQVFTHDDLRYSASIGWERCQPGRSPEAALHDADQALYAAKSGRGSISPS